MPEAAITIRFATNRDRDPGSTGFAKDSAPDLPGQRRLVLGSVSVKRVGGADATETPRQLRGPPAITGLDNFADPKKGDCAKLLDAWLAEAAANGGIALLFVHGFMNSFNDSMGRAAQIQEFYEEAGQNLVPLAFSWPSDGTFFLPEFRGFLTESAKAQYRLDQRDAMAAGPALARLFEALLAAKRRAKTKAPRMALLTHSMGNLVLQKAMAALGQGVMTATMKDLFDEALLVAADVSSSAAKPGQPLLAVAEIARRVSVLTCFDPVLDSASRSANGDERLGHDGPPSLDGLPANLRVIDVYSGMMSLPEQDALKAKGGTEYDLLGHQYYRNDTRVRAAIAALLQGAEPAALAMLPAEQQRDRWRTRHAELTP